MDVYDATEKNVLRNHNVVNLLVNLLVYLCPIFGV